MSILGDKYPRLASLIGVLDTSTDQVNLTTGSGSLLFDLPQGQAGSLAMERITKFKAFLERVMVITQNSRGLWDITQPRMELSEKVSTQDQSCVHAKRASIVVNAIFNEFGQLSCRESHELKLRVSDEWQTGLCATATLDIFVSSCPDRSIWQQAKCGTFQKAMDRTEKDNICEAIRQARETGRVLHLCVDPRGLFDISDKMPPIPSRSNEFAAESLGDLLDQKAFIRITPLDYLKGAAVQKYSSQEKATLALSLARCLMDFFDEDLELASYSWKPESVYFLRPSGALIGDRVLYISLRPNFSTPAFPDLLKTVRPGNPVLLSFARLLLEIDSGEKIPMAIHPESRANVSTWGELCDFVDVAGRDGNNNYLRAVEGCLYLHMALPKSQGQPTGPTASEVLRKAIYEQIVRNLELTVNPQSLKRKRSDLLSELPQKRMLSISSPPDIESPEVLSYHATKKSAPPAIRDKFEIAIVCALPCEYDAVYFLMDEVWDEDSDYYGGADGDPNIYTAGRMEEFNVVLVLLPNTGKASAAGTAASLRLSYPGLRLVLLIGICGGVPCPEGNQELLLGDVVISRHIVQYDLGRRYPDQFHKRDTAEDGPSRAPKNIHTLLTMIETTAGRERLEQNTAFYLQQIQRSAALKPRAPKYQYPGSSQDNLFQSSYQHKHHLSPECVCAKNHKDSVTVCEESRQLSCDELGCDKTYVVQRERLKSKQQLEREGREEDAQAPSIFVGRVASGDSVMKSAEDRDKLAKRHGVIAFEMEGAGLWDEVPCVIVKAVSDYADSHKNDIWKEFATATAASAAKALLKQYSRAGHD
ncbi:predicted protein [Aspergillus terreus NIH2624]|uniref:Uncharacterized protein n=1 Tax=Aspergillus terreus (strain NIH 2624 / FGSC A1156) TaxID=341663 RepID=Q0C859_ASPTN|nr:uncharacterized protein ATEG_10125 [Aspergillus terreus NIH2624]EAU29574.1 predicted protein [Aspergillus terreus NIH2624]